MQSAFGVDHGEISKADNRKNNVVGSAVQGAGGVAAGTGLVAGGVPGAKSDFSSVFRVKPGEGKGIRRAATTARNFAPGAKATPGGILGFRLSAHKGGTYGFVQQEREDAKTKPKSASDAFFRGRNAGKIEPEVKVMHGMARGKTGANALLAGGAGAVAWGRHKKKEGLAKSQQHSDSYNATLAGAGAAGAGISHGASAFLDTKRKKYEASSSAGIDEAQKLVPGLGGRQGKKLTLKQMHKHKLKFGTDADGSPKVPYPKTMYPEVSDSAVKSNPGIMHGVSRDTAHVAGALRGKATQERHFAEVLGDTAKVTRKLRTPSAIVGGVGAGGLIATHHKKTGA